MKLWDEFYDPKTDFVNLEIYIVVVVLAILFGGIALVLRYLQFGVKKDES